MVIGGCEVAVAWVKRQVFWCDLPGEVVADAFVVSRVLVNKCSTAAWVLMLSGRASCTAAKECCCCRRLLRSSRQDWTKKAAFSTGPDSIEVSSQRGSSNSDECAGCKLPEEDAGASFGSIRVLDPVSFLGNESRTDSRFMHLSAQVTLASTARLLHTQHPLSRGLYLAINCQGGLAFDDGIECDVAIIDVRHVRMCPMKWLRLDRDIII